MAQVICVKLNKAEAPSLGFRLQGGKDFGTPLLIQKVNIGSPAERSGLHAGDSVIKINNTDVYNLRHKDAQDVIIRAGPAFEITVQRGGSTWKPSVTPTASIPAPQPSINNVSPVTKTSLAAVPQSSIGAIGTGHNLSAKPFSPQLNGAVNGSSKLVNKQYNSPVGLYSEESIAETLSAQAEVLSTGVLGVNFKKNEKNYDASNSEVFRMVQEADKEPRDQEPEPDTGVVSLPVAVAGLRHVIAPETKATPPTPQLPPGQNICADCERLIVGVFVRIKDKNLHVECFKCSTCGTSLKNVGYYNINNKLYCDVHAKLAARSNPPGPNLIPVTLPPGKPAGTISAALATHPVPTNAPISPSSNTFAQPFQHSEIVPLTEPDGLHQVEDDTPNLVKKLTLVSDQTSVQNGEKTYTTEKTFTIHNNNEKDILKISGPIPFSQYIAKAGTNFGPNPRPFSSVTAPLSSSLNSYASLPKTPAPASYAPAPSSFAPAPSSFAPAPVAPLPGRSIQNIVWPPPPDDCDFPTASPLYFPPPSNLKAPSPPARPPSPPKIAPPPFPKTEIWRSPTVTTKSERVVEEHSAIKSEIREEVSDYTEAEEIVNYTQNVDPKMSFCSAEVTGIIDRRSATQCIETIAETQMLIESVMQQRPKSPPPIDQDLQPKVEVQTEPKDRKSNPSPNEPRIVTRVCVCTNSCCNASEGQLCESCPMKEPAVLRRPGDYHKKKSVVGNAVPRKYESPKITGVSVTINNPGKIKGAIDSFAQIPTKKTTGALGSALSVAPVEPFTPISPNPLEPISLPQETKPYFPPEHKTVVEPRPPPKEKEPKPDTQFVSALRIAPDRAFTPVDQPAPVKKKKPKEDPLLKDLPKPVQWMSMVSALTTASDRPYSPFVVETSSKEITQTEEVRVEEIRQIKETQKEILRRSSQHQSSLPKPFTKPVMHEKFEAVNDDRQTMHVHFPPISDELKSSYDYKTDYSQIKSEISSQIVEQAHLEEQTIVTSKQNSCQVEKCEKVCQKTCEAAKTCCKSQTNVIEKQTEETVLKKPLELAGCLHKREYLPQYQMSLNYDETIQLPHHKDIKKLLPSDQNKQQDTKRSAGPKVATQGHQQHAYAPSPQYKQDPPTKKLTTIQPGEVCLNIPQMSFQPVVEDRPPRTSFSPRPGSLTPSMINKPAPTLPYYQANLVAQEYLAPEVNLFDPKSPEVSRSPSPCPDGRRSPSPFCKQPPRPVSPAAGPPPNPLKGAKIPKFTKEDRMREEAKKNITAFIPQYQGKVGSVSMNVDTEQTLQITVPSQQSLSQQSTQKLQQMTRSIAESCKVQQSQEVSESVQIQRRKVVAEEYEHTQKSKVVEIKTSGSGHPFQKVNNPEVEEHGILGLHVTNPQPINSPFISKDKGQDVSKTQATSQSSQQQSQQPQQFQQPQQSQQPKQSQSIPPQQPNTSFLQSSNAPKQVKPVSAPVSKSTQPTPSTSSNKPNVPQPNSGAGGGKQAGAIGVAPKRGRGVLNVGGLMGSRIATCGHCHEHENNSLKNERVETNGKGKHPEDSNAHSPVFAKRNSPKLARSNNPGHVDLHQNILSEIKTKVPTYDPAPKPQNSHKSAKIFLQNIIPTNADADKLISPPTRVKTEITIHPQEAPRDDSLNLNDAKPPQLIVNETNILILSKTPANNGIDATETKQTNRLDTNNFNTSAENADAPICVVCNSEIERGPFITALGKIWCPDHFICSTQSCRRPLQDLGFVEEQGQLYCEYCFEQYLAPPCSKCSAKVKGDCLKAIGKNFHPECFNCTYCGKLFGNSPFFLEDGAPYCENDWNELFTTKCFACGFPVEAGDRWVEALNNNYHSQCFNCTMCKKNLEGQSFFAKGGRPFCKNHAR